MALTLLLLVSLRNLCLLLVNVPVVEITKGNDYALHWSVVIKSVTELSTLKEIRKISKLNVMTVEYDPNRTAFIALLNYDDGEKRYIVAPSGIKVGQKIVSGASQVPTEMEMRCHYLKYLFGTIISCVELRPEQGAVMARSAGTFAQLMAKDGKYVTIKLPSGETRMILSSCIATVGSVSNSDHQLTISGKAGRSRWLGRRPRTRPVVMNPVDHPMGGGEGKSSGGHPRSRNGIPAKGYKTRSKTKPSNKHIIERKKNKIWHVH